MKDQPMVSVIIPTHNRPKKLKKLIDSILSSDYKNIEVVVVDDASAKGMLQDLTKKYCGRIQIIRNNRERLLAGSRNVGILNSKGNFVFLIDDDNVVAKDTIRKLVNVMIADNLVGVAGPIMFYMCDPSRVWCGRVKRNYITTRTFFPERDRIHFNPKQILESDDFPNALMIRRSLIDKVGLFDEVNFPIHYDEADFCIRSRRAGFLVVLVPSAHVWHDTPIINNSLGGPFGIHINKRAFYIARNRILFHKKYSRKMELLSFIILFLPLISAVYIRIILTTHSISLSRRFFNMKCYIKGIIYGFYPKHSISN